MFEKHCQVCGIDVKKETAVKRFGKFFCSDPHAEQYVEKKQAQEKAEEEYKKSHPRRGGCC